MTYSWAIVVQSLSRVQLFVTPWTTAHQASLSFTISWSLLKLMSTESVMPSNRLILCHPPPLVYPSGSGQFSSIAQSCPTLCDPMDCSMSRFPVHHQLLELAQTHVHWVSDAIKPSHPLLPPSPPSFNLSQHQGLFQWVCSLHQVVKVLEFQLKLNEYSGLILFRNDRFDLFIVQRTLKSLLKHHSSKASVLQHSAFFMVQLSYLYMTTGKTIALTR